MSSPTSRSLEYCRKKLGWHAQVVERWNQYARVRQDLFGCIDVIAIAGDRIVGIQATSGDNHASRREKALAEPRLKAWLAAGALFEVWSWAKRGDHGKRKLWTLRRDPLILRWGLVFQTSLQFKCGCGANGQFACSPDCSGLAA